MASCRTDLATFCQNVEAGGGKRIKCLAENQLKLSPECAAVVQQRLDARNGQADKRVDRNADKSAAGAPAAGPNAAQSQFSSSSQTQAQSQSASSSSSTATAPDGKKPGPMAACRADLATLCANVQRGGGARIKCLKANAAKVSPTCADAIAAREQRKSATKGALKSACREDSRRLCKDAAKESGGRLACLKQNTAQLSPSCAAVVASLPQKPAQKR
jgi:hypothetical protein